MAPVAVGLPKLYAASPAPTAEKFWVKLMRRARVDAILGGSLLRSEEAPEMPRRSAVVEQRLTVASGGEQNMPPGLGSSGPPVPSGQETPVEEPSPRDVGGHA